MRIMLDTNVLISAFVFQSKHISDIIDVLTEEHTIVLSSYVIEELKLVWNVQRYCRQRVSCSSTEGKSRTGNLPKRKLFSASACSHYLIT